MAAPTAPQAMPYRAWVRQPRALPRPTAPGSASSSRIRTFSSTSSLVTDARIDALVWMSWAENPGVCGSTRNPRTTPSSALAQTSATSAIEPLVIHILVPSSAHPPETRRARVCIAPGSLPAFGSVRPKHPIFSPAAIAGSQALRCSSLPYAKIGYMTSAPCTEANDRTPLSPRSSSCMMSP